MDIMMGIHSFWIAPTLHKKAKYSTDTTSMLTWIASAVSYRKNMGPIRLYTDLRGLEFVKKHKLDLLYNAGIDTQLNDVKLPVDNETFGKIFWAASKIFALHLCHEPQLCCVDLDAVIWKKLPTNNDITYLHDEDNSTSHYVTNRTEFKQFIPENILNNDDIWKLPVANTAIMEFRNRDFKEYFTDTSIQFMFDYIKMGYPLNYREMIFAEQRMLPLCAGTKGVSCKPFGVLENNHLKFNPFVTHLWDSKRHYKYFWDGSKKYCNFLIKYIRENAPYMNHICDAAEKKISSVEKRSHKKIAKQREQLSDIIIKNITGELYICNQDLPVLFKTPENYSMSIHETFVYKSGSFDVFDNKGNLLYHFDSPKQCKSMKKNVPIDNPLVKDKKLFEIL